MNLNLYALSLMVAALLLLNGLVATLHRQRLNPSYYQLVGFIHTGVTLLVGLMFLRLIYAFIVSDFTYALVYTHSNIDKPLLYKITAIWGNHEGSFLFFVLILMLINLINNHHYRRQSEVIQAAHYASFIYTNLIQLTLWLYVVVLSNPFIVNKVALTPGLGLNPILQNPLLAIHPPILYLGFVSSYSLFINSFVLIYTPSTHQGFVLAYGLKWVKFGFSLLTLGIGLGSFWAYRELGWGGYWFWDPVENASTFPWFIYLILLHLYPVLIRNQQLSTLFYLQTLALPVTLFSTLLIRSNLQNSVHAFAVDPSRGIALFSIIMVTCLLITLGPTPRSSTKPLYFQKDKFLVIAGFLFTNVGFIVVLGTVYPLIMELLNQPIVTVGFDYYHITFSPFVVLLTSLLLIYYSFSYTNNLRFNLTTLFLISFVSYYLSLYTLNFTYLNSLSLLAILLGFYLLALITKQALLQLKASSFAHIGFTLLLIGVALNKLYEQEFQLSMSKDTPQTLYNYQIELVSIQTQTAPNYLSETTHLIITPPHQKAIHAYPERRLYSNPQQITTEPSIHNYWNYDLYLNVGETLPNNTKLVRVFIRPYMGLIWLGILLITLAYIPTFIHHFNRRPRHV